MGTEEWKKIRGFKYYEVSTLGSIRNLAHRKRGYSRSGKEFFYMTKDKILKPIRKHSGYSQVGLPIKGKMRTILIHRLVAEAFLENPLQKPQINHKDGNGFNNYVNNLEWCTASENGLHTYRVLGNVAWIKGVSGESHPASKPVLQKTLSGKLIKRWGCGLDAVREGGFDGGCISKCASKKSEHHKGFIWEYA